jgi:hypothetical protein
MNHEESIKTQAAEGYLLGQLPAAAREEFERHYFECPTCAEDVRLGYRLSQDLKMVFHEQPRGADFRQRRNGRASWLTWAPVAAGLAIASVSGYQNAVQIPALRARTEAAHVFSPVVLAPASRAKAPSFAISAGNDLQLSLAPGAARNTGKYECRLRSDSGAVLWKISVEDLDPESNLTVVIPTARLSAGNYELTLFGAGGTETHELDHYPFSLRFK